MVAELVVGLQADDDHQDVEQQVGERVVAAGVADALLRRLGAPCRMRVGGQRTGFVLGRCRAAALKPVSLFRRGDTLPAAPINLCDVVAHRALARIEHLCEHG